MRKAIMRRTHLQNLYFKSRTTEAHTKYKKQKNYCSRLYKKERKRYFQKLNLSNILDNKKFWKTIKPFFSDKGNIGGKISLARENEIITDDKETAQELNNFFENATKSLGIEENQFIIQSDTNQSDLVEEAIEKYRFHPSILLIQNKIKNPKIFKFNEATCLDIEREINSLTPKKQLHMGIYQAKF